MRAGRAQMKQLAALDELAAAYTELAESVAKIAAVLEELADAVFADVAERALSEAEAAKPAAKKSG